MRATEYYFISKGKDGAVTISGPEIPPKPDRYNTNGFDSIGPYVSRFLAPSQQFKSLMMFTPGGKRGFMFIARDGRVEAHVMLQRWKGAEKEAIARKFFSSLGIAPSKDYLAGNGGVPDMTRILSYPIQGSAPDVTLLAKRILEELCSISPTEALNITYQEK